MRQSAPRVLTESSDLRSRRCSASAGVSKRSLSTGRNQRSSRGGFSLLRKLKLPLQWSREYFTAEAEASATGLERIVFMSLMVIPSVSWRSAKKSSWLVRRVQADLISRTVPQKLLDVDPQHLTHRPGLGKTSSFVVGCIPVKNFCHRTHTLVIKVG